MIDTSTRDVFTDRFQRVLAAMKHDLSEFLEQLGNDAPDGLMENGYVFEQLKLQALDLIERPPAQFTGSYFHSVTDALFRLLDVCTELCYFSQYNHCFLEMRGGFGFDPIAQQHASDYPPSSPASGVY